jgi:hypothetical protein
MTTHPLEKSAANFRDISIHRSLLGCEISEVRSRLAKGSKRGKRDARPLKIHREFIGLCENALKRALPCALRKGKPAARRWRKAYGSLVRK